MKPARLLIGVVMTLATAAYGHFAFIVLQAGGRVAELMISEDLSPDSGVSLAILQGTKLSLRDGSGKETPLTLVKGENTYTVETAGKGTRIVHGFADLGITPGGRSPKPYLLLYYPKTVVGSAFSDKNTLGGDLPVELVPAGKAGEVAFLLLVKGKALAGAEVTVILPSGTQKKVKTNELGVTESFTESGRYGAWARFWEPGTGEREGKKYEELRHYATLVFDAYVKAPQISSMPEATSSFGAVADKEWVYVYGGHISPTHSYSTESVSGKFQRMNLVSRQWESLPGGPGLQGLNLAIYGGKVYRVGGMQPRNAPGEKQAIYSVADVARFDPGTKTWEALPPLPENRSSHDLAVIDGKLIVTGGWILKGPDGDAWTKSIYTLDLAASDSKWKSSSQPFERRALITAVHDGKMYVMGGITRAGAVSADVDVYDPKADTWSKGSPLPGTATDNFAPAACDHQGRLFVSLADGTIYRLNDKSGRWLEAGVGSPRLAHRMVSAGDSILVLGGAEKGKNLNVVEAVKIGSGS